jgi:hypothetical protein
VGVGNDDHVDGLRPRLWTATINRSIVHPQVIYEHGELWWDDIDGESSWLIHQSSLAILPAEFSSIKSRENYEFSLRSIFVHTSKWFFTCRKILRHEADGFASPPKDGVLRIFIAFKNASLRPGWNPRTLWRMADTLTIAPPRRLGAWDGSCGLGNRPVVRSCEHGNEPSGFIKGAAFVD